MPQKAAENETANDGKTKNGGPQAYVKLSGRNYGSQVGINYGSIEQYILDGRVVKLVINGNPFDNVPFTRDDNFIGRELIREEIEGSLQPTDTSSHPRVALVGLPGVGKTQIVVEYVARLRRDSPDTWVFWVDAKNEETFLESYHALAKRAEIPGWDDAKMDDIPGLVFEWLKNDLVSPWLLILDGNDDANMLFTERVTGAGKRGKSLVNYIPDTSNGSILITSRDVKAGKGLGASVSIHVPPLDKDDAVELLRKKVPKEMIGDADIGGLVKKLEYLPLAITHAATYISETPCTVPEYLAVLEDETEFASVLATEVNGKRKTDVPWSVMSSWTLSFKRLQERSPRAVELLQMICFLDRHNIPKMLLQQGAGKVNFLNDMVGPLLRFSFLSRSKSQEEDDVYEMPSLVHLFSSIWTRESKEAKHAAGEALKAVSAHYPPADDSDEDLCRQLSSHTRAVLKATGTATNSSAAPAAPAVQLNTVFDDDTAKARAALLHNASSYEMDVGNVKLAEKWADEAWQIRKARLGEDDTKTLESMYNSARAYFEVGNSKEAVRRGEEVVRRFRGKMKGGTSEEVLIAQNTLVTFYLDVGKWAEAETLSKSVVEASTQLGPSAQTDTWDRKMTRVEVWRSIGKHELAQQLVESIIDEKRAQIRKDREEDGLPAASEEEEEETSLCENTYDLADTLLTLALICRDRGMFGQAREYAEKVVKAKIQTYGETHPNPLRCQISLALIYQEQGELAEAKSLGQQVTAQLSTTLGQDHPETLTSWSDLVWVYEKLGMLEVAEKDAKIIERLSADVLGEDHRQTLLTRGNLASIYRCRGKLAEAAELGKQVLRMRETTLGRDHPDVLIGVTNLALTYQKQGRYEDVRKLFRHGAGLDEEEAGLFARYGRELLGSLTLALVISYTYWRHASK
ncbi:P-loop containing nucleoside triphosphate hydrolase protein [Chaetomium tenue]|uniref:P-loop containing nucleoside triphosphate hydrolase protein n=1 Tax=Chaetomium tenue TaxID=1854479 RepID=A0ACB7PQK1_9PEZI|nr:P-loop containing nucleoside triphosphate hydrolase protein [Chaetomium globosum]